MTSHSFVICLSAGFNIDGLYYSGHADHISPTLVLPVIVAIEFLATLQQATSNEDC